MKVVEIVLVEENVMVVERWAFLVEKLSSLVAHLEHHV